MTRDDVQAWLDRYVAAWRANDPELIGDLFADDAAYRWRPYGGDEHAAHGRAAIVQGWLDEGDAPDSWEAAYEPYAVEGHRAVAIGTSHYLPTDTEPARTFSNCFLLEFDSHGRCTAFTEFYMRHDAEA